MKCHVHQAADFESGRHGEAIAQIALALTQYLVVDSQYQRLIACIVRPVHKIFC